MKKFETPSASDRAAHRILPQPIANWQSTPFAVTLVGIDSGRSTMPRQLPLSIVAPDATASRPPRELGQHGLELWDSVQREYRIVDRGGIELLAQACSALDLVESIGEAVARDGAVVHGRTGPKAHPLIRDQLAARAFLVRTLERLGITTENKPGPGRPPSNYGWTGGT